MRSGLALGVGLLVLVLCPLVVTGCSGAATTGDPSPAATSSAGSITGGQATTSTVASVSASVSNGTYSPGSGAATGLSAADRASMKKQLDAMQKEIDALSLPSDSDFSDAAGAVY